MNVSNGQAKMIINCHIHIFTQKNVPSKYPPFPVNVLSRYRPIRRPLVWLLRNMWPFSGKDTPHRYANLTAISAYKFQKEIFEEVRGRYPLDTKFIVLPMDLRGMRRGTPKQDICAQHEELKKLAAQYPEQIIPFIHIDPRSASKFSGPEPLKFIKRFHEKGFRGIKLYPPLGYSASAKELMPIYEYANKHQLPVMIHCSRGGVKDKKFTDENINCTTAPHLYRAILSKFENLKICLAHYGGGEDWEAYLKKQWLNDAIPMEKMNWLSQITTMIRSGEYPNLFTDISYTIFKSERYVPILKVLLQDDKIRKKVLFGSDYYMIELEKLRERELAMRLRGELGEALFFTIAHDNPKQYLKQDD